MLPTKPYLIRAFHECINDCKLTPYIVIDAKKPGNQLPEHLVKNGQIVLDISAKAVKNLSISNDYVEFEATFSGNRMQVYAPVINVLAIYAQEDGCGMVFTEEDNGGGDGTPPPRPPKKGKPSLKVVK